MELAYDIVRKKSDLHDVSDLLKQIRMINLKDPKLPHDQRLVNEIRSILKSVIDCNDDIGDALISAYFISTDNTNNPKLINAAARLVSCIENGERKHVGETFLDCIDHYYSLYRMSKSSDQISKIDVLFNRLEEKIKAHLLASVKGYKMTLGRFKIIDKMFSIDPMITAKRLLSSYRLISAISDVADIIWKQILNNMNSTVYNREHLFIIMVAELRMLMIPKLISSLDRKRLYYKIDIEEIIQAVRNRSLSTVDVMNIIRIFSGDMIDAGSQKYECWNSEFNEFVVESFRSMFDRIGNR